MEKKTWAQSFGSLLSYCMSLDNLLRFSSPQFHCTMKEWSQTFSGAPLDLKNLLFFYFKLIQQFLYI